MKNYEKPLALANSELAEGVFMASGAGGGIDCYKVSARINQRPQTGRGDYRIQVDAHHNAKHHGGQQILTISFNQPVTYSSCNGNGAKLISGDGTSTLRIEFSYHQNPTDNIGFGDLVVKSEPGLAISESMTMWCNHDCGQH